MNISEVKINLNKTVSFKNQDLEFEGTLTSCLIKKNEQGEFYYLAEIEQLGTRSVVYCDLSKVKVK